MSASKRSRRERSISTNSSSSEASLKRLRTYSRSPTPESGSRQPIRVYLVTAKLDSETISELYALVENSERGKRLISSTGSNNNVSFEMCLDASESDVIITNVRMRKRLERHVPWPVAQQKPIVTVQWLRDSAAKRLALPCGDYAALQELREETVHNCPDGAKCSECSDQSQSDPASDLLLTPSRRELGVNSPILSFKSRYACQRASPLVCANQDLAIELDILRRHRELEGLKINSLAYERTVGVVKAFPEPITVDNLRSEIEHLPGIGSKTIAKIKEFVTTGFIAESQEILKSQRFQSLSEFNTVYGIGPATARELYDRGLRTLDHLAAYYEADLATLEVATKPESVAITKGAPDMTIKMGLALREDFNCKIPRAEVEEMHRVVMAELDTLEKGCVGTIVGGYRRGKSESNDVDIVITHPDQIRGKEKVKGLCAKLVRHLYDKGLVTHVMHLSSFHEPNALRTGHWDSLEKALTVFVFPNQKPKVHRRLDLIFASPESYWTAVTGWTGSRMFERDLRLWAKEQKGFKFDSTGITRRHDSKVFYPKSEADVFRILGLEWVDPTLRNAGV